jgi:hypothetical protein
MPDFLNNLSSSIKIDTVLLPEPLHQKEFDQAEKLADFLADYPTKLEIFKTDTPIEVCGYLFTLLERATYKGGTKIANAFILTRSNKIITYLSRGMQRGLPEEMTSLMAVSDVIIIGANGYTSKSAEKIDYCSDSAEIFIHSDNTELNDVARRFYDKKGVPVIKTETPISIFDIIN